MNIADAGKVLAYASVGDNRTVTREAALIWSEALDSDISVEDARAAINTHFANSTEYLKPAHINEIVRGWIRERSRDVPPVVPPWQLADRPTDENAWRRTWQDSILAGHTESAARQIANRQFDITEDEPRELESGERPSLRETYDREQREIADRERMAQIKAEVERRQKAERKAEQAAEIAAHKGEDAEVTG